MKIIVIIFLSIVGVFNCYCQTTNTTPALTPVSKNVTNRIEGQIYITRKDRETVKMSLVYVRIVDAEKYSAALSLVNSYVTAKRNDAEWRGRAAALVNAMPRMSVADRNKANKTYTELRAQVLTNLPLAEIGAKSIYELFSEADWQEERKVQTDADGNFSVEVPAGSWRIIALSKRKIMDKDEEYIWIVPVPDPPVGRIFLNNSNLWGE